ncbi:MAG: UDP-N-acetylmuramate dehydrogenase [Phycisphaerales bacterium]|nr:UDP-N-acetylmuramate dehydrogenase [Phycisphaerales bacterium]
MRIATSNPFVGLEAIVQENHRLADHTWYRIGGPARYFIQPQSVEQLQEAVRRCNEFEISTYILGLGANILVPDEGINGAVFVLQEEAFRKIRIDKNILLAGAGVDMQKLLLRCVRSGLAGIECLAGIPGTIGGGLRMNAGGKYGDIGSVVSSVTVMDQSGEVYDYTKDELVFDYRSTNITAKFILSASLELEEEDPEELMRRTKEIWMFKRNTQPLSTKSCGCIFKNPRGLSAGALIDQAGLKGMRVGGAEVSSKHANFVIAHGGASAADVLKLIKLVREKVYDKSQIVLENEVIIWP